MWHRVVQGITVLLVCATLAPTCFANTEIINFRTSVGVPISQMSPALSKDITVTDVLIPGQTSRISIPRHEISSEAIGLESPAASVIKYFSLGLDDYLRDQQSRSHAGSWLCKTFLGGCDVNKDKGWTARISWPATTPSEYRISIVEGTAGPVASSTSSHDRIIKVEVQSAGVPVPPHSLLQIFSRESNLNHSVFAEAKQDEPGTATADNASRSGDQDALVFDIVVEPLLFGFLPMGSWYTGAAVIASIAVGYVAAIILFRVTSI